MNNDVLKEKNNLALAGFIVSIVSLFINFCGVVGLVAAILSGLGLGKSKEKGGKGLAVAGLIIGIISVIYGIYSLIVLVVAFNALV